MKKTYSLMLVGVMAFVPVTRAVDRIVTTTAGTGAGSLTEAIKALANGDTIKFAIAGAGPHYIQVPPDGFPLITNNNITIDGYSQPGASPNTASIHAANNAVLKIVLTATNGNALSMQTAVETSWGGPIPRLGYGDDEQAILGFFHATNATVQGLVIQANPFTSTTQAPPNPNLGQAPKCKAICFAANSIENGGGMCQNWRISGCWFGVDPVTKQVAHCEDPLYGLGTLVASPAICIASYRTRNAASPDNPWWNFPGTIGVAVGSANPRAEFNVFVTGYGFDSEGINYRFSGNFWGVLPDGVTSADMGVLSSLQQSDGYIEVGRNDSNLTIGTDGDGVNDDQEGNLFGPMTVGGTCMNFYSDPRTNIVVAGNYFGVDINGNAFGGINVNPLIDSLGNQSTLQFGSDFNGVSDALEANKVVNTRLLDHDFPSVLNPNNLSWVAMRGNSLSNCTSASLTRPPLGDGQTLPDGQNTYAGFIDINGAGGSLDIIPIITSVSTARLIGTCGNPVGAPYTRIVVDVYQADPTPTGEPQGLRWLGSFDDNSTADSNPAVGAFTFNVNSLGIAVGAKITLTASYLTTSGAAGETSPFSDVATATASPTLVTTTASTGAGSLTEAIKALANGDTIKFAIAGAGPHYIQVPPDGFPLITNNNITIDGYSQPGASPNTASIHAANNAVLKIVLTATNGNALSMQTAVETSWGGPIPRLGYGDDEQAILGFFHATNATVQGLVIQANPFTSTTQAPPNPNLGQAPKCKAICFAANSIENGGGMCQNWRISGCWFGVDPVTKQVAHCEDPLYGLGTLVASPAICIASYRTRNAASPDNPWWNFPGTIGVAVGSANPRAEFNVFITGYGFDSEGVNYRFSGNFWGVLPDGVTSADMGVLSSLQQSDGYIEVGRNDSNLTIGTDGDGVNDDQEGNLFGPMTVGGTCMNFYSDPRTNIVVAGNYFGVDINGNAFGGINVNPLIDSLGNQSTLQFGSDFNGVSDALEANKVVNTRLLDHDFPSVLNPNNLSWVAMRGNSLSNCTSASLTRPPLGDGQTLPDGQNTYAGFIDINGAGGSLDIIPVITAATTSTLTGTCGMPVGAPYTRLIVDLYEADATTGAEPQGKKWLGSFTDNSTADSNPAVGAFSFSLAGLGITSGTKVTVAVTYSADTQPFIASGSRAGNQTTLDVTGGTGPGPVVTYGIQKSSAVSGPYLYTAAAVGGSVTFTDNSPISFYRATGPAATGETSAFSDVFTIP